MVGALVVALAMALLSTCALASTAQAVPAKFWGVVPQGMLEVEQFARIKRGGVDSIRIAIPWGSVQATPGGVPEWSGVDEVVARATQSGIDVLPYVYGA